MNSNNNLDPRTIRCKEEYEGKHFFTKNGLREFVIVEFRSASDVTIEYIESGHRTTSIMQHIKRGLKDPFEKSCVYFDDKQKQYGGAYFRTNQGYVVQVLQYNGVSDILIRFVDSGYTTSVTAQNLKNGEIRNPFHPNKFGGYIGVGEFNGDEYEWLYRRWNNMLIRANDPQYYSKYHGYSTDAYENVLIAPEWLNYNTFAYWYMDQVSRLNPNYSYDLDKDLLYPFYKDKTPDGKKCYSPFTCVLIPHELNNILTVNKFAKSFDSEIEFQRYKLKKEANVRDLAQDLYKKNAISEIAYQACMCYRVEIVDLRGPQIDQNIYNRLKNTVSIKLNDAYQNKL